MFRIILLVSIFYNMSAYAANIIDDHDISNISKCWREWSEYNASFSVAHSCLKQEYKLSDARLNKVYGDVSRYIELVPRTGIEEKVDVEQLNMLKDSQRAWIKFRDKECALVLSNEDTPDLSDPHSEATWLSCMIIQTNTRVRQLQIYLNHDDYYPSPLSRG